MMKHRLRADLDQQIADKVQQKKELDDENKLFYQKEDSELQHWRDAEKKRLGDRRSAAVQARKNMEAVANVERQARSEELRRKKEEERAMVQEVVREIERDNEKLQEKKNEHKRDMEKLLEEVAVERTRREEAARVQRHKEIEVAQEYQRKLEREAAKKEADNKERLERIDKAGSINSLREAPRGEAPSPRANPADYKANGESRAKARQEWAEEQREIVEKQRRLEKKNCDFLMSQMQEKERTKAKFVVQKQDEAQQIVKDAARANNMEVQRSEERRMKNVRHREVIQAQISEHSQAPQPHTSTSMTAAELAMNRQMLTA